MEKINNLKLRMKLWETLTDYLDGAYSNDKINEICLDVETQVLIWLSEEGLEPKKN